MYPKKKKKTPTEGKRWKKNKKPLEPGKKRANKDTKRTENNKEKRKTSQLRHQGEAQEEKNKPQQRKRGKAKGMISTAGVQKKGTICQPRRQVEQKNQRASSIGGLGNKKKRAHKCVGRIRK